MSTTNITSGSDFIGKTLIIGSTALAMGNWSRAFDFNNNSIDTYMISPSGGSGTNLWFEHIHAGGSKFPLYSSDFSLNVYYIYVISFVSNTQLKFNIYRYDSPSTITIINSVFFTISIPDTFLSRLTQFWLGKSAYTGDAYYNGTYNKIALYNGDIFADADILENLRNVVTSPLTNTSNSTTYIFRPVGGIKFLGVVVNMVNVPTANVTDSSIKLSGTTGSYLNITGYYIAIDYSATPEYEIINISLPWNQHRAIARTVLGRDLAVILNDAQNTRISTLSGRPSNGSYIIGGSRRSTSTNPAGTTATDFEWVTGAPWSYQKFFTGGGGYGAEPAASNGTVIRFGFYTTSYTMYNQVWDNYGNKDTDYFGAIYGTYPSIGAPSAPSAPTNVSATATGVSNQVRVTWTSAISNGSTISDYRIQSSIDQTTWTLAATATSLENTKSVSELTNGTPYYFRIITTSNAGDSVASAISNPATPFTVPNTPRNFTAVAGVRLVDLSWSPPLFNGGRDISSYLIQRSNNGINAWGSDISTNALINTFRVNELGNNTRYYFRIYAINIAGPTLVPSLADTTTFDFPGQPTNLNVTSTSNGVVRLTWTPPSYNGGSPITGYSIKNNYSEGTVTFITDVSATVTGLTNKSYDFSLVAITAVGNSQTPAIYIGAIPFTTPSAPTGVLATAGNAKVDLSWNSATSNGSTITDYRIEISENLSTWATAVTVSGGETSKSVSPLTNGTPYYFRVITISSNAGNSPPSSISSPVTPFGEPEAPINVTATSRNAEATINWSPPTNDGGRPITSYSVTSYSVTSSSDSFQVTTANGSTRRATISGLTNGTSYTFRVIATNEVGDSTMYGESNIVTPNGPPLTNKKVAISNDGKVVALSSSYQSDISKGRIYVYELSYNQAPYSWNQLGLSSEILVGLSNDDQFGWDLALSSNGKVVAGSSIASDESGINCGQVRLFELSSNTNSWIQKGFAINGQTLGSESGYSISLAGNGNRIAIGAWKDNSNGTNAGAVRVYDFSANVNDWRQQGQTLLGDSGSYEGYSTALSSDGLTLATGCLNVNNDNNIINAGKVKTFTWTGITWENKGIIQGADISYLYFGRALKLSANGNTIVVGAPGNNIGQVYRYQGGTTWTQLGQTLVGISGGDEFGTSVAISNDGTIVSIGSDNNSSNRGHVRVFAYANNYWNQVSNVLSGKTATSKAGIHALSGDGTTLIQSNNTYNTVYGINKTLAVNAPMTTISGNLIVMGNISVNSLDISTNHIYRSDGYSYKMFSSDLSSAIMKEYYSDVISTRNLKVQITGNGNITNRTNSYKALSDSRLKENIVTSGPKLADLLKVRVVDYTMKGSTNTKYIGVLAQELEELFPNLVTELEPSPKDIEDGRTIKYKAVNYSSFDAILIKSLQEQNAMLKNITKRIEAIEAIEALEEK